ncbi:transposable element Tcb2 transposase [Trichonephila clavipes]|nr:transposable element Tcb2 transposase [Trichonephila clavipes]
MKLSLLTSHASVCNTTMVGFESRDTMERGCEQLRYAPSHWSCTGYYGMGRYWISLSHSSGTHCRYFKHPALHLRGVGASVLPYLQVLATDIFQQDNALPHVARIVQRFFVNHQIELLPWPARSPDFLLIENMWSMVAQRLTQITPPAATLDQLWQRVEAAWQVARQLGRSKLCCEELLGPSGSERCHLHDQAQDVFERPVVEKTTTSDESRFNLSSDDNRVRVWKPRGERFNPAFALQRHTAPIAGVMVWGAIAYNTRSLLVLIYGTMTAQRYVHDILQPHVLPLMQRLPGAIFHQDNARPHTARVSQDCLRTITTLPWYARSPDLSVIEHD